jgi:outer membrane protein OmpA-like peptidoglycan-associated protein
MNTYKSLPIGLLLAATLAACSSLPVNNPNLDEARSLYGMALSNPQAVSLAAAELKQAGDAVDKASAAWTRKEDVAEVDKLSYLAKQRVVIAQETSDQKVAELAVTNATSARDKVRLEARTREADSAKLTAQTAQIQSSASQRASEDAQRQTREAQERTGQLEAQLKELNAKNTARGMVITIGDVLFDTNKALLKTGGLRSVEKLAEFFKQNPLRTALVEGFTDSTGSETTNQELSDRRANAVRTALVDMGVSGSRITTYGYGEAHPVAGNDNAGSRQLNRRVEVVLSDDKGKITPR